MSGYSPEFDWNPKNDADHCIVIPHQPAIAVYLCPRDEVVIRQQDQFDESDDGFVYVTKKSVVPLVQRMLGVAGIEAVIAHREDGGLAEPLLLPAPKDKTAAQRMRRYRNKNRNTVTDEPPLRLVAAE
jgi:hypothetical protein